MVVRKSIEPNSNRENVLPFLSAACYQEIIEANQKIARADYDLVIEELQPVADALKKLERTLKTRSKQANKVVSNSKKAFLQPIADIYKRLIEARSTDIEHLQAIVRAKKRTIDHFTIVMMGRTKAGKSTLFSTLLGTGYERIGIGKQRTTRKNYAYDLGNGIQLIDTPGIAAVGGEEDEAEALKAVDEADLICYVVTNDSIQKSEFDFFCKLKQQTKPLIILLNVQDNLEDDDLLELFLEDADEILTGKDIQDHQKRIFDYARKNYNNDSVVVIPVMLLAARLSRQKQNKKLCENLYHESRIQNFLNHIDDAIRNYGSLLTSQTLIGETSVLLKAPLSAIRNERKICQQASDQIEQKHKESEQKLKKLRQESLKKLELDIDLVFANLVNQIPDFARRHWERNQEEQQKAWSDLVKNVFKIEDALQNALEKFDSSYKKQVQEILDEVSQDINFSGRHSRQSEGFSGVDPGFDLHKALGYGAVALGIGGVIAGLGVLLIPGIALLNPIGIIAGVGFAVLSITKNLLADKTKRQREACNKIEQVLREQVDREKKQCISEIKKGINKHCDQLENHILRYFDGMSKEFETIAHNLSESEHQLFTTIEKLTGFFALRILDWCNSKVNYRYSSKLGKDVVRVQRDPNKFFKIHLTGDSPPIEKQRQCSQMLGEQISFFKK